MRNFIGRSDYLQQLEGVWRQKTTRLVALYGRRRVGKTELIRTFSRNKKAWLFEAIEGADTLSQIKHFLAQLSEHVGEPYIRDLAYADWPPVFDLFSQKINEQPELVIAFDELSWMAAGRTRLVSYLKYYWDKTWKRHRHVMMILCGSVAAWMVKNVVKSNALYGRLSETFLVEPLKPFEVAEFVGKKRGAKEVLDYLLLFGGIPRYLEEFDFNRSLALNIDRTCFHPSGFFVEEADKIFYNQFKETQVYKQIVKALMSGPLSLKDIAAKLKSTSSGGFKLYLDNLMAAGIVEKIADIRHFKSSALPRYHMSDEFLRFHFHFIRPHLAEIRASPRGERFEKFTRGRWYPAMGYAFERFCLKYRYTIAECLNMGAKVVACGPLLNPKENGFQYDLVYLRNDEVITVCEVKYLAEAPGPSLIREMEAKMARTSFPKGASVERVLISNRDPSAALRESGYFHHYLVADEIVQIQT